MESHVSENSEAALLAAAEAANKMLEKAANGNGAVLFLIAGGSGFGLLARLKTELLSPDFTLMVSDERFDADPKVNNCAQLMATEFFSQAKARGASLMNTLLGDARSAEELGKRMDKELHEWRVANPNGRVIMTQGIGPDGHTCGMMPFPEDAKKFSQLFENKDVWAVGYDAGGKNEFPLRASVTISFLLGHADESIAYAVGANKTEALRKVMADEGSLAETPARVIRSMRSAILFTDQAI